MAALLCQEHHASALEWNDLYLKARGAHWHLQGSLADVLPGGSCSAGVGIATRAFINMGLPPGWKHDISTAESPGRLAAAWIEGVVKGGLIMMSTYLWHSEGMTPRNMAILEQAGAHARMFKGPSLLAGDFIMTPERLGEEAGDLLRVERRVVGVHTLHSVASAVSVALLLLT